MSRLPGDAFVPVGPDGGGCLVYHGDCVEAMSMMPDGFVDIVVTDPPYGVSYKTSKRKDKGHRFCREIENDSDLSALADAAPEMFRVLKDDSACFAFCAWKRQDEAAGILESCGFDVRNRIIWDKGHHTAGDLTGAFGYQYEVILFAVKGKPTIRGKRHSDVWRCPSVPSDRLLHQNEKPIFLLERAILSMSDEGCVVLDPFMGSGSTGAACSHCGREFIGCEVDDGYYEVALGRLSSEWSQGRLPL